MKQIDGYVHTKPYRWDIAAAVAILEDMGGRVSSFTGTPLNWHEESPSIIAAYSPKIHEKLLDLYNQ